MSETNAIVTSGAGLVRTSVLLAGREAGGQQDAGSGSSPPLAGRRRCTRCGRDFPLVILSSTRIQVAKQCPCIAGERSGPANDQAHTQKGRERGPDNTQD
jgi:hypothetical protein